MLVFPITINHALLYFVAAVIHDCEAATQVGEG